MSEKHSIELTIKLDEDFVERLKTQLREAVNTKLSATNAVYKALELYGATAKSVRLDEPERRELESRSGASTPIRNSRDILRSAERMSGGPNRLTIEVDDMILALMKDRARDYGFGIAEFAKQVLEESWVSQFMETCELHPVWFTAPEWTLLKSVIKQPLSSGRALLTAILEMAPKDPVAPPDPAKTMQLDIPKAA